MSESAKPTPPYDGAPRSLGIIKAAATQIQAMVSLASQAKQIMEWSRVNASLLDAYPVSLDRKKWQRFVSREATYTSREPDLPILAWHWFFEKHRHAIEPLWLTAPEQPADVTSAVVTALNSFLSPGVRNVDLETLRHLEGEYAAYRPSFVNLDQIMVMQMTCGIGDDPSRFAISMRFDNDDEEDSTEHVEGYAIPYQDCILFTGKLIETKAPFIFILSDFPIDPKTGKYSRGDGTLLVGARGTISSAYPITIRRTTKTVDPQTYEPDAFVALLRSNHEVVKFLKRGIVGWR